jgi:hypothetical protein
LSLKGLLTTTAVPKEAKTTQKLFKLARFGLLAKLSGRISTGSSFSASRSHNLTLLTTWFHFVPHLTRKSLIVNRKLEGCTYTLVPVR